MFIDFREGEGGKGGRRERDRKEREGERQERERETSVWKRNIIGRLPYTPWLRIQPATYACALDQELNLSYKLVVYMMILLPTEPSGQAWSTFCELFSVYVE